MAERKGILPTKKTPKVNDIEHLKFMFLGEAKVGKSTIASRFPGIVFLSTEPGLGSLEVYQAPIDSWDMFISVVAEIAQGKHAYKTVAIDTLDNLYLLCVKAICKRLKVKDPADTGHGKGWGMINAEFNDMLTNLSRLPYGHVWITHAKQREYTCPQSGKKYDKIVPTLSPGVYNTILGIADVIGYCYMEEAGGKQKHMTRYRSNKFCTAGDRTGYLPDVLETNYYKLEAALKQGLATSLEKTEPTPEPKEAELSQSEKDAELFAHIGDKTK
jgi:hypothetical protein